MAGGECVGGGRGVGAGVGEVANSRIDNELNFSRYFSAAYQCCGISDVSSAVLHRERGREVQGGMGRGRLVG